MPRPPGHFPPPSEPDARFDAVVARGAQIRRRERTRKLLVSGGVAVVAIGVVAIGVLAATRTGSDQSPVSRPAPSSTSTVVLERLTVDARESSGALDVHVADPDLPVTDGAQVCVRLRLQPTGPARTATATGTGCWTRAEGAAVSESAVVTTDAEVGCSATISRPDDGSTTLPSTSLPPTTGATTGAVNHEFRFTLPNDLPAGDYVVEVQAASGAGDACPTQTPGDGTEVAETSVTLSR